MTTMKRGIVGSLLLAAAIGALLLLNHREHPRGSVSRSGDGKTYLSIDDDNGGRCGDMVVDGAFWPYAIGEAGPIEPGQHSIHCGSPNDPDTNSISVEVPEGVLFRFDYWGP